MTEILRGKPVAEELKEQIKQRVEQLKENGKTPNLPCCAWARTRMICLMKRVS